MAVSSFDAYVAARTPVLLRFAFQLSAGDHARAEDLVQSSLIKLWPRWAKVCERGDPDAYVKKIVLREHLSWRRRRAAGEVVGDAVVGGAGPTAVTSDATTRVDDTDQLVRLLRHLPPRQQAVLVLRFAEDLSDRQAADLLGCQPATVRAQTSRALARLRAEVASLAERPAGSSESTGNSADSSCEGADHG